MAGASKMDGAPIWFLAHQTFVSTQPPVKKYFMISGLALWRVPAESWQLDWIISVISRLNYPRLTSKFLIALAHYRVYYYNVCVSCVQDFSFLRLGTSGYIYRKTTSTHFSSTLRLVIVAVKLKEWAKHYEPKLMVSYFRNLLIKPLA